MPHLRAVVNRLDRTRLEPYLTTGAPFGPATRLRALLDRAVPVAPERVPPDVVTMNSRVVVRDERGRGESGEGGAGGRRGDVDVYVLAYPDYAGSQAVYVLSPWARPCWRPARASGSSTWGRAGRGA